MFTSYLFMVFYIYVVYDDDLFFSYPNFFFAVVDNGHFDCHHGALFLHFYVLL